MKLTQEMIDAAKATPAGQFLDRLVEQEFKSPTGPQPSLVTGSIIQQVWDSMVEAAPKASTIDATIEDTVTYRCLLDWVKRGGITEQNLPQVVATLLDSTTLLNSK